jgi:uncharacterized protein
MNDFWQRIFLTVGILIAVFGMRLVFPLLIVGITANLRPVEAINLAMEKGDPEEPGTYGYLLNQAHPLIAAFGGMFLLMLFLDWLFEEREISWLRWLERPLARIGKLDALSVIIAATLLVIAVELFVPSADRGDVMVAGVLGLVTYLAVNGLGTLFETGADDDDDDDEVELNAPGIHGDAETVAETVEATDGPVKFAENVGLPVRKGGPTRLVKVAGKAAFFLFLYLEVLDASFSFDGVIGAFAITSDPIIIALGLGFIGAMYVRSLTVYLVRKGTLQEYVYLEHGAHWAIGALAVILLLSLRWEIPEIVTGLIGVAFIAAAFLSSVRRLRRGEPVAEDAANPVAASSR